MILKTTELDTKILLVLQKPLIIFNIKKEN